MWVPLFLYSVTAAHHPPVMQFCTLARVNAGFAASWVRLSHRFATNAHVVCTAESTMATGSISNLPTDRHIAIRNGSNSKYLTLLKDGLLTFTASEKVRLAVHEVVYKTGLPDDVVLLRCANGRFWRLSESDSRIRADWESIPGVSDTACHFTTVVVREGVIAFRSVRNGQYAKRYSATGGYTDCYSAMISSLDQFCEVQVSAANDIALTLPRYLTFKGDNDKFMANYSESGHYWQKFHKENADLSCIYEVAPLLDGSVSLSSIEVNRFLRLSPNWIWADSTSPTSNDCHFEPVKLSNTMLALKSMVNNQFVKRYSDYWNDCLCAVGTSVNDLYTHLTMIEAVKKRTLSNIRYLLDLAEISDIELIMVGEGALKNNTLNPADLQVTVTLTRSVTEWWPSSQRECPSWVLCPAKSPWALPTPTPRSSDRPLRIPSNSKRNLPSRECRLVEQYVLFTLDFNSCLEHLQTILIDPTMDSLFGEHC